MPIPLECPNGHAFRVADKYAGKRIACKHCQAIIKVPTPAGGEDYEVVEDEKTSIRPSRGSAPRARPADEDAIQDRVARVRHRDDRDDGDDDEEVVRRVKRKRRAASKAVKARRRSEGFNWVRLGLGFHYMRIILFMVGLLFMNGLFLIMPYVAASGSTNGTVFVAFLTILVVAFLFFIVPIVGIIGSALCFWTPSEARALWLVVTSLVLDLVTTPLYFGANFVVGMMETPKPIFVLTAQFAPIVTSVTAWVFFMLYLKQLCEYLDERPAAKEAMEVMTYKVCLIGAFFLGMFFAILASGVFLCIGALMFLGVMGYGFYFTLKLLVRELNLVGSLRQVLYSRT